MSAEPAPLERAGERVRVHTPTHDDLGPYRRAVEASRERLRDWNPVDPNDLAYHLRIQSGSHRTFLVRALEPEGEHDLVGKVNVTNVVRGRAMSASMGYDSYDPYAGRGLFAEGLALVVDLAFAAVPAGMGLHRLEASVQPANTRSAGLLRRLGFRPRGSWPDYLWLSDGQGREAWRDHLTFGLTREAWPARDFEAPRRARPVVLLLAPPERLDAEGVAVGRALAVELGAPLLRLDGRAPHDVTQAVADAVTGAVVLTSDPPEAVYPAVAAAGAPRPVVARLEAVRGPADLTRLALDALAGAGVDR